ncbi:MAG: nucleotidyltransferase domain-containing protein [Bacillota bacterium]
MDRREIGAEARTEGRPETTWEGKLVRYLELHPQVAFAFLFGSYGRARGRATSDVDVAVYLRQPFTPRDVAAIWGEMERITGTDVDLLVLNDAPPGIAWAAMTGKLLVNKDPRLCLEEMLRVSREAEDFRAFVLDFWDLRCQYRGG